jgi:starch phosphorylase
MKLSLNGALTIGTWDGANIEIAQHVGEDNIFIFGHRVEEIEALRSRGYNPWDYYNNDSELRETLDTLRNGDFAPEQRDLFQDLFNELTQNGDGFFYLADYRAYCQCQDRVAAAYRDKRAWARMAILNVARMGWFSSDRSIREYNDKVWHAQPLHIDVGGK